ncbi:MAG TPA: alpha/beta fold hydrolase [Candidatus Xenobia bacterium]|jgi:hypothetical protein
MKKTLAILFLWLCLNAVADPGWSGTWLGHLTVNGQSIRILFNLVPASEGWKGTMDSPDQLAGSLPLSQVEVHGRDARLALAISDLHYVGTLAEDGSHASGTLTQNGKSVHVDLVRSDPLTAPTRPQDPRGPFPYEERPVVIPGPGGNQLAGTLTVPRDHRPAPAVLLIAGSGPHDRDETIFGHHPFWVLADRLSRDGWAVLRVDKRGCGHSTGDYQSATTHDFAADALAEYRFLLSQPDVDSHHVGLIGHSEGGMIAPLVASHDQTVSFVVLMAGPGVPLDQLMLKQQDALMRAENVPAALRQDRLARYRRWYDVIKASKSREAAHRALLKAYPIDQAEIEQVVTPWFYDFVRYDPAPALRDTQCPILALDGTLDLQVDADMNLKGIADTLTAAHHKNFKIEKLPGLNHLFQTATTGDVSEYGKLQETLSPVFLSKIETWMDSLR